MTFIRISICLLLLTGKIIGGEQLNIKLQAEAAILINADTGQILYEKNAYKTYFPASLTKISTVSYALKTRKQDLDKFITTKKEAVSTISEEQRKRSNYSSAPYLLGPDSGHIGLKVGEELTLLDLMYGTMLASGGDSSNVIAQYIGGTIPKFMEDVNAYLKSIGCKNSHFNNPHGRHHPDHVTTAYDLAILTRDALQDGKFREIVKTVSYPRRETKMQKASTFLQTNKLLRKGALFYEKAIGVKTGYTIPAGHCLASAAQHNGRTLIAILLKNESRDNMFRETAALFEAAFNQPKVRKVLLEAGPQTHSLKLEGAKKAVTTFTKDQIAIEYYPAETPQIKCLLFWDQLNVPIQKGQRLGEYRLMDEKGKLLQTIPLYAQENVDPTLTYKIKKKVLDNRSLTKTVGVVLVILMLGGLALQLRRR